MTVERRRAKVICLPVNLVMDIEEVEREPSEDVEPLEDNLPFLCPIVPFVPVYDRTHP